MSPTCLTNVHSLAPNSKIPKIVISPVGVKPSQEDELRRPTEENLKPIHATKTEYIHADQPKHGDFMEDRVDHEFENDQVSVWDAIKIGGDILQQVR